MTLFVAVTLPLMAQDVTPKTAEFAEVTTAPAKAAEVTTAPAKAAEVATAPVSEMKSTRKEKKALKKEQHKNQPKVSTEFGLGIGGRYNWFYMQSHTDGFSPNMSMPWAIGGALQFRLNIGRSFGFQPEISYARSTLKIDGITDGASYNTKVKSNVVQIPMLLSFRLAMFRLNFGPVFTLMDDATYQLVRTEDESIQQMHIGKLYPAITYTAGISVKFAKFCIPWSDAVYRNYN
jgi:hypothetical protein